MSGWVYVAIIGEWLLPFACLYILFCFQNLKTIIIILEILKYNVWDVHVARDMTMTQMRLPILMWRQPCFQLSNS